MGRETIYGEDGPVVPNGGIDLSSPFLGVEHYDVGQWYPTADGSGKPSAVQFIMQGNVAVPTESRGIVNIGECNVILRLKTAEAVDELCRALIRSRKVVWPNEPVNVY